MPLHPPDNRELPVVADGPPLAFEFVELSVLWPVTGVELLHRDNTLEEGEVLERAIRARKRPNEGITRERDPEPTHSHSPMLRHVALGAFR